MASNSPGDDEEAQEYGNYSRYIQLDLTPQQTDQQAGNAIELHELNAGNLAEDKYITIQHTGPNQKSVPHNITSSGVAYAFPNKTTSTEDIDYEKYRRPDQKDAGIPHVKTETGLAYAVPKKPRPQPRVSQEDDDKYMNIDEIETERVPDYAAPDEDEAQTYNAYGELDHWGDGSFNSAPENARIALETQSKGKNIQFPTALLVKLK